MLLLCEVIIIASGKYKNLNNEDYWKARFETKISKYWQDTDKVTNRLKKEFNIALTSIQKEISYFYSKFSKDGKVSYADAIKGSKIPRFTSLMNNIQKILLDLEGTQQVTIEDLLSNTFTNNYYETIYEIQKGIKLGFSFTTINKKIVEDIIKMPWSGEQFSERIHSNTQLLAKQVKQSLVQGFIQGKSNQNMAKDINNVVGSGYKNCLRVARTESAYIANKSTMEGYKECDLDQYQYIVAYDERTCSRCSPLNDRIFNVDDSVPGINISPIHPNCRCSTIPYFGDNIVERIARDKKGKNIFVKGDMSFEEWKKRI